jgi:glycosyltransferase involved in cell wall biosynthesis
MEDKLVKLHSGKKKIPHSASRIPHLNKSAIENRKFISALAFSLSVLPLLARAERVYRKLPQLPLSEPTELPPLSIIVPARNEAHNLRRLLPSLLVQHYPGHLEIIVVDDNSEDETAEVVDCEFQYFRQNSKHRQLNAEYRHFSRDLRLIRVTDLPPGWLGKPHAAHIGAAAARGQWLLFTDADMVHDQNSAASAVAYAETNDLHGLSLFPRQETRGLADSAVLMVAFIGLFAGQPRKTTMLNGQYVLLRRDVYEASGGFAAVCSEMLEDLAFGKLLANQGYRAPIMRGETLASVHMYDDWRQMWHSVTRIGAGSLRFNGSLALIPAIFVTGVMMPLWTFLFNRRVIREFPRLRLIWLMTAIGFLPWARRFNNHEGKSGRAVKRQSSQALIKAGLAPVAAGFVFLSALWGLASRLLGRGLNWKGRRV